MTPVHPGNRLFVGTVPSKSDLAIIDREHWYRVPVDTVRAEENWPPAWFAPWETTAASAGRPQQIRAVWSVSGVEQATREQLFPDDDPGTRRGKRYWRLALTDPEELDSPIITLRRRQSVFIYSDVRRLASAVSINDLWCNSTLEDRFWDGLKARKILAERQWATYGQNAAPAIFDFAVFCTREDIDIEVDGDQHHTVPAISRADSRRDNATQLKGFRTLRFDSRRVRRDLNGCLNEVERLIHQCGGVERQPGAPNLLPVSAGYPSQLRLFGSGSGPGGSAGKSARRKPRTVRSERLPEGRQTRLL